MKRYFPNYEKRGMVNTKFAKFSIALDEFAENDSLYDTGIMDPKVWWAIYGTCTPILPGLAMKLLGHPCSSSSCERNWSTYKYIHSIKKNKLTSQRAEDMVYIQINLRFC